MMTLHDLGVTGLKILYSLLLGIVFIGAVILSTIWEGKQNERDKIKEDQE